MDHQFGVFTPGKGNGILLLGDGRRGLHRCPEDQGHAGGDAAQDTTVAVGFAPDGFALHDPGIIVGAAPQLRGLEAQAEFDAPDSRDSEHHLGNAVFHAAEHGIAPAHRQAHRGTLDDAADGIALRPGLQNGILHGSGGGIVENRECFFQQLPQGFRREIHRIESAVRHVFNGLDMGGDGDAQLLQNLNTDAAGDAERRGQPSGEVTAACHILFPAVFHMGGVIGMARSGMIPEIVVVTGAGIGIFNDGGDGGAAGHISHQAGEEYRLVRLFSCGGCGAAARSTAAEEGLQPIHVDGNARGDALHGHTDGRGVGLAENGDAKSFAVGTAHKKPPVSPTAGRQVISKRE